MDSLLFGTAGIPISTKGNTIQGIKDVRKLGLESMELEFVRSVNIKEDKTQLVKEIANKNDIILSSHASYYINLNSNDKKKVYASINRVIESAIITSLCGGWSVCFHAGYYQKDSKEKVYEKIKEGIRKIINEVKEFNNKIWIRPEISGRVAQFGNLNELIKLSQDIEQVTPCIDFAHSHARSNGRFNTKKEFSQILEEIEKGLGKEVLRNMHIHVSGIEYNEKGEKNHLNLEESDLNYKDLIKVWKEFNIKGIVISESPNIEKDALLMQKLYKS